MSKLQKNYIIIVLFITTLRCKELKDQEGGKFTKFDNKSYAQSTATARMYGIKIIKNIL